MAPAGWIAFPAAVVPVRVWAAAILNDWGYADDADDVKGLYFTVEDGVVYSNTAGNPSDSIPVGPLPEGWDDVEVCTLSVNPVRVVGPAAAVAELRQAVDAINALDDKVHALLFGAADAVQKRMDLPAFIAEQKRKAVQAP